MPSDQASAPTYLPAGLPEPEPQPDGLDVAFWEATRRHELVVQQCARCAAFQIPPEWLCHRCQSFDLVWRQVSGRGRIFSWERVWHPVLPTLRESTPYVVVLVELPDAENVRLVGNLLGDPHQEIRTGSDVEAVFEDHDGFTLVQWRLVEST